MLGMSPLWFYFFLNESLRETTRLMNSPASARRLMDLIAHLEQHIHKTRAVSLSEGI